MVEDLVPKLCNAGYTIVSGLMYGVDQLAHKKTLECGGVAVAVLGWGIERANDPESDRLADEIVTQGGVVMSEYPADTRGQLWSFPQRNRIVVGLSDIIIVVEAGIKSGTMSTVKWAEKMSKPVYAVPGSMFAKTSEGANYMIETGLARPLTKAVVEALCGSGGTVVGGDQKGGRVDLNQSERVILGYLQVVGASSINEIVRGSKLDAGEIMAALSTLELKGIVVEERGIFAIV
ncbi:MAG: hypothetical protein Fur0011_7230 [Candidatus Microgenomates bacterium]